jgi:hypothetical protein
MLDNGAEQLVLKLERVFQGKGMFRRNYFALILA